MIYERIKNYIRRSKLSVIAYTILVLFTVYAVLDTFVIPRNYAQAIVDEEGDSDQLADASGEEVTYSDDAVEANAITETTIEVTEHRYLDTTVYVADIYLGSEDSIKTAFAEGIYGKNVKATTSEIAEDNGATLAINGDFYGARNEGYVIRNGVLYRDTPSGSEDLVIYGDGSWEIVSEHQVSAQELLDEGAVNVFSFGPALIEGGEIAVDAGDEVGKSMASNPRTAIGQISDNHYVFVVSDGRTSESRGLSLRELAEFMEELGVKTAYNMDGGGSSTMVYRGEVINNPTTSGKNSKERSVSDIVYI